MVASAVEPISAAVLTGGMSRRMGSDKALLDIGGRTILERTIGVLAALSNDVMIVGARDEYRAYGAAVVADAYPESGPLGGIATALTYARNPFVVVVGCDMPCLNEQLLEAMARMPRDYDALVPLLPGPRGMRHEPLHALYGAQTLSTITSAIDAGEFRLQHVLTMLQVQPVDAGFIRQFDPSLRSFTNVNTPDELQQALTEEAGSFES